MTRPSYAWKLPAAIEARLGSDSYGPQRIINEDKHLLVVLHQPPGDSLLTREAAVFLRRPDGKWLYQGADNGAFALGRLLEAYRECLTQLEARLDKAASADNLFQVLDQVMPLARAAGNLREALQAAREAVKEDLLLIDSRDRAADIARGFELLQANARVALDYRLARNAEEQMRAAMGSQRAQHKFNILAAWTLPLMTVAALFGMNLPSGLENSPALVFWGVFVAGMGLGMVARGWVSAGDKDVGLKPAAGGVRKKGQ